MNETTTLTAPPGGTIETPSGKDASYENFPVGSWLLPRALRPHIAVFYRFARVIDDIADNPDLSPNDKIRRLDGFAEAVTGRNRADPAFATGHAMFESLTATSVVPDHCLDLIHAFKQDATKSRYNDWDDLIGYCILSAAPVGRYLLDLHGGSKDGYGPSDALCIALQIINHLQDCQDDYRKLDRVYLPQDWMAAAGARVEDLDGNRTEPPLRTVFDRCLDGVDELMIEARRLPNGLSSRRLAMESAAIICIADRLGGLLRRRDPLEKRVKLTKAQYLSCCVRGAASALLA